MASSNKSSSSKTSQKAAQKSSSAVYYSSKPGWRPSQNPNATVVYTDSYGKPTGNYSVGKGGTIATTVPTKDGGTQTVNVLGQVTTRDAQGRVVQSQSGSAKPEDTSSYLQKTSSAIKENQQVIAQQKVQQQAQVQAQQQKVFGRESYESYSPSAVNQQSYAPGYEPKGYHTIPINPDLIILQAKKNEKIYNLNSAFDPQDVNRNINGIRDNSGISSGNIDLSDSGRNNNPFVNNLTGALGKQKETQNEVASNVWGAYNPSSPRSQYMLDLLHKDPEKYKRVVANEIWFTQAGTADWNALGDNPSSPLFLPTQATDTFNEFGRMSDNTGSAAKVYRGGLAFAKGSLAYSNPITGGIVTVGMLTRFLPQVIQNPGAVWAETKAGFKAEPYENIGFIIGAHSGSKYSARKNMLNEVRTAISEDNIPRLREVLEGAEKIKFSKEETAMLDREMSEFAARNRVTKTLSGTETFSFNKNVFSDESQQGIASGADKRTTLTGSGASAQRPSVWQALQQKFPERGIEDVDQSVKKNNWRLAVEKVSLSEAVKKGDTARELAVRNEIMKLNNERSMLNNKVISRVSKEVGNKKVPMTVDELPLSPLHKKAVMTVLDSKANVEVKGSISDIVEWTKLKKSGKMSSEVYDQLMPSAEDIAGKDIDFTMKKVVGRKSYVKTGTQLFEGVKTVNENIDILNRKIEAKTNQRIPLQEEELGAYRDLFDETEVFKKGPSTQVTTQEINPETGKLETTKKGIYELEGTDKPKFEVMRIFDKKAKQAYDLATDKTKVEDPYIVDLGRDLNIGKRVAHRLFDQGVKIKTDEGSFKLTNRKTAVLDQLERSVGVKDTWYKGAKATVKNVLQEKVKPEITQFKLGEGAKEKGIKINQELLEKGKNTFLKEENGRFAIYEVDAEYQPVKKIAETYDPKQYPSPITSKSVQAKLEGGGFINVEGRLQSDIKNVIAKNMREWKMAEHGKDWKMQQAKRIGQVEEYQKGMAAEKNPFKKVYAKAQQELAERNRKMTEDYLPEQDWQSGSIEAKAHELKKRAITYFDINALKPITSKEPELFSYPSKPNQAIKLNPGIKELTTEQAKSQFKDALDFKSGGSSWEQKNFGKIYNSFSEKMNTLKNQGMGNIKREEALRLMNEEYETIRPQHEVIKQQRLNTLMEEYSKYKPKGKVRLDLNPISVKQGEKVEDNYSIQKKQVKSMYFKNEYTPYKKRYYPKKMYVPVEVYPLSSYNPKKYSPQNYSPGSDYPNSGSVSYPSYDKPDIPAPIYPSTKSPYNPGYKPPTKPIYPVPGKVIDQNKIQLIERNTPNPLNSPVITGKRKRVRYQVLARRHGIMRGIAITDTAEQAFEIGRINVSNTAAASFKVRALNTGENVTPTGRRVLPSDSFYESKKEPGVFIQKAVKRINTPGEKREITFKGIFASKFKSSRKNIFNMKKSRKGGF